MTKRRHRTVWICNAMFMYGYLRYNEGLTKSEAASHVISFFTPHAVRWLDTTLVSASDAALYDAKLYMALYHRIASHIVYEKVQQNIKSDAHTVYKRLYGILNKR